MRSLQAERVACVAVFFLPHHVGSHAPSSVRSLCRLGALSIVIAIIIIIELHVGGWRLFWRVEAILAGVGYFRGWGLFCQERIVAEDSNLTILTPF